MTDISNSVGYNVLVCSNDDIIPVEELKDEDAQKIVIFDDFICEKNQKPLIDYFIRGRHKNCSVIYLSQSFYKTPKDIRLNCSHFCVYDFPSSNERSLISRELGVNKDKYIKATNEPLSFLYIDKPMKRIKDGAYYCYCAYVLRISRYSGFLWVVPTNTGIILRGLKLYGESRT